MYHTIRLRSAEISILVFELPLDVGKAPVESLVHLWISEPEAGKRLVNDVGDDRAHVRLVIGRDRIPGRLWP